jgi:hypothetical protein
VNDFEILVELDFEDFLEHQKDISGNWVSTFRPIDFNTENYEKNIVFLGCSITYGLGVDEKDTYPAKVQELSNNKWNCMNFGICGGSIDMAYLIYHKIKHLDIDAIVFQWPSFYRRAYFENGKLIQYYPTLTKEQFEFYGDFANISDIDYCVMRNLSNIESINGFKKVYNLSPKIGHDRKDLFKKYGVENILDFHYYYETPTTHRIEDGHPNELWYKEYAEYLFKQIL